MSLICRQCGRDIDAIGQDNMSHDSRPLCEDCYEGKIFYFDDEEEFCEEEDEWEWE